MCRCDYTHEVDTFRLGKFTFVLDHLFIAASEEGNKKQRFVYAISMNTILGSSNLALLRIGRKTTTNKSCASSESRYYENAKWRPTSRQMERSHHRSDSSTDHSHSIHGTGSNL